MKRLHVAAFLFLAFLFSQACSSAPQDIYWYAIELDGQLIGFQAAITTPGDPASGEPTTTRAEGVMSFSLLGYPLDATFEMTQKTDASNSQVLSAEIEINTGGSISGASFIREGDVLIHTTQPDGVTREIPCDDDLIIDEYVLLNALLIHPGSDVGATETYKQLEPFLGRILHREYTAGGETTLILEGQEYTCLLFSFRDISLGVTGQMWLDPSDATMIRTTSADGTVIYLSDRSIRNRTRRVDLNSHILAETGLLIEESTSIEYMKVRAEIRTSGEVITAEALNVPGQSFEGTVTDNLIEGIFEIEHPRYSGENAPSFPSDYSGSDELKPFLEPGWMIESDDPVLVEKAREITAGSNNSWEAAVRLSRWVGSEISGSLPGGSARQTFDKGSGECGAHSRLLAAFCRAVGIPARMVMGGAYTPIMDGSFGQHGWNEVWMGEAGWIPVDCTFQESDYLDSGHIRFGLLTTFNPTELEILDYRLSGGGH